MALSRVSGTLAYVASFGLGRGALFAAPLLLANLLDRASYGRFETAYAAAALAANVGTLGMGSLVPLVLIGNDKPARYSAILLHHLLLGLACALVALAAWMGGLAVAWPLGAALCAAIATQALLSMRLKTESRPEASVLMDAALFSTLAACAAGARVASGDPGQWVLAGAVTFAVLLSAHLAANLRREGMPVAADWSVAASAGWPLMIGGLVSLLATTSGRLGMGLLAPATSTADYAVLSRAAAVPIVMHQLVLIARFRNLFELPLASMERSMQAILAMVAASAAGFWIFAPLMRFVLGPAFDLSWGSHTVAAVWILAQSVLWSAIALNDLAITRLQAMRRVLPKTLGGLGLILAIGYLALVNVGVTVEHFVVVHSCVMLAFYALQSWAIALEGQRLWHPWLTAGGSYLALCSCAWLLA